MSLFKYLSILYNFVAKGASHYSILYSTVPYRLVACIAILSL
jgi:hypothetical protein